MRFYQLLDSLPIVGVFAAFTIVAAIMSEGGYRLGRWWQNRTPDEKEEPTAMIVGSLLALMGFLFHLHAGFASHSESWLSGAVSRKFWRAVSTCLFSLHC